MKHLAIGVFIFMIIIPNASAHVVISEVFYDAAGSDNGKEFVELYNPTSQDIDITGWSLERGNGASQGDWVMQAIFQGTISSNGFYLIGEHNVTNADIAADLDLQNGPDAVRIKDSSEYVVDTLGYGSLLYQDMYEGSPAADVQPGHSLERRPGNLEPQAGNSHDTNNNSADFLDRETPEPQNSGQRESPGMPVIVTRTLHPQSAIYLPNTQVNVSLVYSFLESQVGFIIREINTFSPEAYNIQPDYTNQTSGLSKWLFRDKSSVQGMAVTYTFTTPPNAGHYSITGSWESVDINGSVIPGISWGSNFNVGFANLLGIVEDVIGNPLEGAMVSLAGSTAITNSTGSYSLPMPASGTHDINSSKEGYIPENATINASHLHEPVFNFTGNTGLIPIHVDDTEMLVAISRWASNVLGDIKILEVIHQWASTPE